MLRIVSRVLQIHSDRASQDVLRRAGGIFGDRRSPPDVGRN
jgi:hypothetical protein